MPRLCPYMKLVDMSQKRLLPYRYEKPHHRARQSINIQCEPRQDKPATWPPARATCCKINKARPSHATLVYRKIYVITRVAQRARNKYEQRVLPTFFFLGAQRQAPLCENPESHLLLHSRISIHPLPTSPLQGYSKTNR